MENNDSLTLRECCSCRTYLPRLCHFWKRSSNSRDSGWNVAKCFLRCTSLFSHNYIPCGCFGAVRGASSIFVKWELKQHNASPCPIGFYLHDNVEDFVKIYLGTGEF